MTYLRRQHATRVTLILVVLTLVTAACDKTEADTSTTLGAVVVATTTQPVSTTTTTEPPPPATPIPLYGQIRTGVLDNGLTYYILKNDRPGVSAELRLAVASGSRNETEEQKGYAHFLEHMAFNGTTQYPGTDIVDALQDMGVDFGPEVNAYTTYDSTVYSLNVPAGKKDLAQALNILREWASEITLDAEEVEKERGVVLEELRLATEDEFSRISNANTEHILSQTPWAGHDPIGNIESIEGLTTQGLKDYYTTWYKPELMAVIAVGDFSPSDLEIVIQEVFADLESNPQPLTLDIPLVAPISELSASTYADPDSARASISVLFHHPAIDRNTEEGFNEVTTRDLAFLMLDNRFEDDLARGEYPGSSVLTYLSKGLVPGGQVFGSDLTIAAIDAELALTAIAESYLQVREYGFSQAELDRAVEFYQTREGSLYESRNTTQDWVWASRLIDVFLEHGSAPSPQARHNLFGAHLDSITVEDVNHAFTEVTDIAPRLFYSGPTSGPQVSADQLSRWWEGRMTQPVLNKDYSFEAIETLMARPASGHVAESEDSDEDGIFWRMFTNGIEVLLWPTDLADNSVSIFGASPGGLSLVDGPNVGHTLISSTMVSASSPAGIDPVAFNAFSFQTTAWADAYIDLQVEGIYGESDTADLETLFQLINLRLTAPNINEVQLSRFIDEIRPELTNPDSKPTLKISLEVDNALYADNPWLAGGYTPETLDAFDLDEGLELYKDRLYGVGEIAFVIVGDFELEVGEDLAAAYLGSIPTKFGYESAEARTSLPSSEQVVRTTAGTGDQSNIYMLFAEQVANDPWTKAQTAIVTKVLSERIRDLVREELGAAYSTYVIPTNFDAPDDVVQVELRLQTDPARVDEISAAVHGIISDLAATGPTQAEFDTAVEQLKWDADFVSNFEIAQKVALAWFSEYDFWFPGLESLVLDDITLAETATLAKIVFGPNDYIEVIQLPKT